LWPTELKRHSCLSHPPLFALWSISECKVTHNFQFSKLSRDFFRKNFSKIMLSLHQHSLLSLLRLQNYKKIRLHTNKIATIVLYGVNNFIILSPGALFFAFSASPTGSLTDVSA
ncbi:MAG: hypothetical protein PUD41_06500, partial [bacterium]|nr:hypothetical protein [bacterium]